MSDKEIEELNKKLQQLAEDNWSHDEALIVQVLNLCKLISIMSFKKGFKYGIEGKLE